MPQNSAKDDAYQEEEAEQTVEAEAGKTKGDRRVASGACAVIQDGVWGQEADNCKGARAPGFGRWAAEE